MNRNVRRERDKPTSCHRAPSHPSSLFVPLAHTPATRPLSRSRRRALALGLCAVRVCVRPARGALPPAQPLNLAREGWIQHEKKSGRPVVSIHPKERHRRRLRVTARGAHTNTGRLRRRQDARAGQSSTPACSAPRGPRHSRPAATPTQYLGAGAHGGDRGAREWRMTNTGRAGCSSRSPALQSRNLC